MADNSLHTDPPLRWRLEDLPKGILREDREALSLNQDRNLFKLKNSTRFQDVRYLASHPEIRAITSMLVQTIMAQRPTVPLHIFCSNFFSRPREQIENDLKPFLPSKTAAEEAVDESESLEPCWSPSISEQSISEEEAADIILTPIASSEAIESSIIKVESPEKPSVICTDSVVFTSSVDLMLRKINEQIEEIQIKIDKYDSTDRFGGYDTRPTTSRSSTSSLQSDDYDDEQHRGRY